MPGSAICFTTAAIRKTPRAFPCAVPPRLCHPLLELVRGYSRFAAPLHALTRKGASWDWTLACARASVSMKNVLTNDPCLAFADFAKPFRVTRMPPLKALALSYTKPVASWLSKAIVFVPPKSTTPEGNNNFSCCSQPPPSGSGTLEGAPTFQMVTDHEVITCVGPLSTLRS